MWIQTDLEGAAANKLVNYWFGSFRFNVTAKDALRLRFGIMERFLADPGETGVRTDDIGLAYSHVEENLVGGINLAAGLGLTAPVSFYSQLAGTITVPSVSLDVSRKFGFLTLAVRGFGAVPWQRYDVAKGGAPNLKARLGVAGDIYAEMPFLPALTIGLDAYTGWAWFYMPHGMLPGGYGLAQGGWPGTTQDPTYMTQPFQQAYGGEVYVRYAIPDIFGIKSDITVALADGDPSLSNARLHDGQSYFYLYYRLSAEMYANLTVRY
jgi:hypothetical protein